MQLLIVSLTGLLLVAGLAIPWAVYRDARARGRSDFVATCWAVGAYVLVPVVIPLYLLLVARHRRRMDPIDPREAWLIWLACSLVPALVAAALLSPPDPFSQVPLVLGLLPIFGSVMYVLIIRLDLVEIAPRHR